MPVRNDSKSGSSSEISARNASSFRGMGLYTILKKHRLKDRQLRLLFLGLDAAGKSTIVARLLAPDSSEGLRDISPTLGFKISTIDFENYKLNICTLTTRNMANE